MKRRNPKFGCVCIARQINHAFGIKIDKDVVRRVLAIHFRPKPGADGPSWLTLIAHAKDSVWCVDLFRVGRADYPRIAFSRLLVALDRYQAMMRRSN